MAELNIPYHPQRMEEHWQKQWIAQRAFGPSGKGEPFYILEMLPYPSGVLHMGHVRNYTLGDVFARFHRMKGRDVLHPMGWDALGLPAENQAIVEKIAPQIRTPQNIARMKEQMQRLGLSYDWQREITTAHPAYYRWNQWFFLQFLKKGWVYRRTSHVNWCPGCNTVLANEQVQDDGSCWRGHTQVTTRTIPEWAFRITAFAEELLAGLDSLSDWPERILTQQRHWLGKRVGAKVYFKVAGHLQTIEVFTSRMDTIYGCTFVALAFDHPCVDLLTPPSHLQEVRAFQARMQAIDPRARTRHLEPEGVLTGLEALHPLTGDRVPLWLANFVVRDYGTGAVMGVPAHDRRDFDFAQRYHVPLHPVIAPQPDQPLPTPLEAPFEADGFLYNSGPFTGLDAAAARHALLDHAQKQGWAEAATSWHLRDWGFSRQRYWGTPIPIIYCPQHGAVAVPENALPVVLPDFDAIELTGQGGAPLGQQPHFYETSCPTCGGPAQREVDTMDTFVDSAWYFARYLSPQAEHTPVDAQQAARWLPVDIYIGGPEHAVMHLLYFRFWTRAMRELGLVKVQEPVRRLITQGMVNALTFHCPIHGYLPASTWPASTQPQASLPAPPPACPQCSHPVSVTTEKMSKSKYNGIDPMDLIQTYGADTIRLYILFAAPPEKDLDWNPEGVEGVHRFIHRVWRLARAQLERARRVPSHLFVKASALSSGLQGPDADIYRALHRTLAKVTDELQTRNHFNTALAALMELVNTLYAHKLHQHEAPPSAVSDPMAREVLRMLALMLAPFAPHLAEELWSQLGETGLIAHAAWPEVDPDARTQHTVVLAVQVNGKLRERLPMDPAASASQAAALAQSHPRVARYLEGKVIHKQIYLPGRLLNFVVGDG